MSVVIYIMVFLSGNFIWAIFHRARLEKGMGSCLFPVGSNSLGIVFSRSLRKEISAGALAGNSTVVGREPRLLYSNGSVIGGDNIRKHYCYMDIDHCNKSNVKRKGEQMNVVKPVVFLGGTCGKNDWRLDFIKQLVTLGVNKDCLFNPVVDDWNDEAQQNEERVKREADYLFFYIGDSYTGEGLSAYSMVEATMALYESEYETLATTVIVFDISGFTGAPLKSLNQTAKVLRTRFPDSPIFDTIQEAIDWFVERLVNVEDV